jgi:acetolactate decarboxylase
MKRCATGWILLLLLVPACRQRSGIIYQNSTIDALLDGNYDGEVTIAQIGKQGRWGLGTLQRLDGEMIAVDGRFYQIRADGTVHLIPPNTLTPFAAVTHLSHSRRVKLGAFGDYAALQKVLDALRPNDGHAYALVINGDFDRVRTRSVAAQSPPYPRLADAVEKQSVFELKDVGGTMVGFWFPASMQHVNVPGYHFHFLAADGRGGGHVLDLSARQATLRLQEISEVRIALPRTAPTTRAAPPTEADLHRVEK